MDEALKFDYQAKTLLIYQICDAPCNGKQYYNEEDHPTDVYPDVPNGLLESFMRKFKNMHGKNVYYHAIELKSCTDKMFSMMK